MVGWTPGVTGAGASSGETSGSVPRRSIASAGRPGSAGAVAASAAAPSAASARVGTTRRLAVLFEMLIPDSLGRVS